LGALQNGPKGNAAQISGRYRERATWVGKDGFSTLGKKKKEPDRGKEDLALIKITS